MVAYGAARIREKSATSSPARGPLRVRSLSRSAGVGPLVIAEMPPTVAIRTYVRRNCPTSLATHEGACQGVWGHAPLTGSEPAYDSDTTGALTGMRMIVREAGGNWRRDARVHPRPGSPDRLPQRHGADHGRRAHGAPGRRRPRGRRLDRRGRPGARRTRGHP